MTHPGKWPWQVLIHVNDDNVCGGMFYVFVGIRRLISRNNYQPSMGDNSCTLSNVSLHLVSDNSSWQIL